MIQANVPLQKNTSETSPQAPKPLKLELSHPITVDGVSVQVLTLRPPKVRDMLLVDKSTQSDAEKETHLFAHLCEIPPEAILELYMADYVKLQNAYQDFLF